MACSDPTSLSPCNVACYDGPAGTLGVGACRSGYVECDASNAVVGCTGQVTPIDEVCNSLDDNCDGVPDNIQPTGPCGTELGACERGEMYCVDGEWSCIGNVEPQPELFDCVDNDCDGVVDNDAPIVWCYTGPDPAQTLVGACRPGYISCTGECAGQVTPLPFDVCGNDTDDDCDGITDEAEELLLGPVAVVFIVDRSGSMSTPLRNVKDALTGFAVNHVNDPLISLYLLDLPGAGPGSDRARPNNICHYSYQSPILPCPIDTFLEAVAQLDARHGGTETSYDAVYDIAVGTTSIAWPLGDAPTRRYVAFFGDEHGQTLRGITEAQVATAIAGTDITFYGYIDDRLHYADYDDIANASGGLLVDLYESRRSLEVSFESIATPFCY